MSEVVSTFNTDLDGWSIQGDVSSFNWQANGGNPGGNLHWVDAAVGEASYWVASSKFLGNKVGYYGGSLSYAVEDTGSGFSDAPDVELIGNGMTLVASLGQAGTNWTTYSIGLDTAGGWKIGGLSGATATQAQIQDVLGHLTGMLIRAEYVTGDESGGLDNAVLATAGSKTAKTWLDGSDNWATAGDWSGGTLPTSSDNVIVAQGNPQITGPIGAHSITLTGAGTGLTVAANVHYAGVLSAAAGTTLSLSNTLVLTGKVALNGATVSGSGRLYTEKTTTVSKLTIGGTAMVYNTGNLTQSGGSVTVGDTSSSAAKLYNTSTGVYAFADNSGVARGTSTKSTIVNAGIFEKTGGAGDSTIAPAIANSGSIKALSGTLDLQGPVTGKGAMTIGNGATLELDAAVAATQTLTFSGLNDVLQLKAASGFKGTVAGLAATDTIDLGGFASSTAKLYYTPNAQNTGGILKLVSGSSRTAFALDGQFIASSFHVAADSVGTGTAITYTPPNGALNLAATNG